MANKETEHHDDDGDLAVESAKPKLEKPKMYKVLLLNDDYTPMDFVVMVLEEFFLMSTSKATQVMLNVHTKGAGICGVFTYEIAETKVELVNQFSRDNQQPLMCTLEADV